MTYEAHVFVAEAEDEVLATAKRLGEVSARIQDLGFELVRDYELSRQIKEFVVETKQGSATQELCDRIMKGQQILARDYTRFYEDVYVVFMGYRAAWEKLVDADEHRDDDEFTAAAVQWNNLVTNEPLVSMRRISAALAKNTLVVKAMIDSVGPIRSAFDHVPEFASAVRDLVLRMDEVPSRAVDIRNDTDAVCAWLGDEVGTLVVREDVRSEDYAEV